MFFIAKFTTNTLTQTEIKNSQKKTTISSNIKDIFLLF